jgi:hypothetical protein
MRHLARVMPPREQGLTPYRVVCRRAQSHPLRSMLDEGMWYRHPEREETAIVWAQDAASIAAVLTYHYQHSWSHLRVLAE